MSGRAKIAFASTRVISPTFCHRMNILNAEKLTEIYGWWPSFHDATVKRVVVKDSPQRSVTTTIHVFEMTDEVDENRYFVLRNHTLTTLIFSEVEDLILEIPISGMILFGLKIEEITGDETENRFAVNFDDAMGNGFNINFKCRAIEVTEARPCDSHGEIPLNFS